MYILHKFRLWCWQELAYFMHDMIKGKLQRQKNPMWLNTEVCIGIIIKGGLILGMPPKGRVKQEIY